MTDEELSAAWNSLRNRALGRGTTPNVSADLAEEVAREWRFFRKALSASPWKGDAPPPAGWKLVARYRRVLAKVKGEGFKPKWELEKTTVEELSEGFQRFNRGLAIGAGVFGAAVVVALLIRGTGGN